MNLPDGIREVRVSDPVRQGLFAHGYRTALRYEADHLDEVVVSTWPDGEGGIILAVATRPDTDDELEDQMHQLGADLLRHLSGAILEWDGDEVRHLNEWLEER